MNVVHTESSQGEVEPIDDPIFFPPVNPNKVIVPHYDALVLTLCINDFDAHRILVDSGSATDLLQLPAFTQMNLALGMLQSSESSLASTGQLQRRWEMSHSP